MTNTEKPPLLQSRWPFGIDIVQESLKADKAALFPELLVQRCQRIGKSLGLDKPIHTFKFTFMGVSGIQTSEPENIKFILAKGFEDFDLGSFRRSLFFPLFGDGIFTQDGKGWEHSVSLSSCIT